MVGGDILGGIGASPPHYLWLERAFLICKGLPPALIEVGRGRFRGKNDLLISPHKLWLDGVNLEAKRTSSLHYLRSGRAF